MLIGSFTTVVFPFFSKLRLEDYKQMRFHYIEAAKLVCWITLPITLLMMLFSTAFFKTLFLSDRFTMEHVMGTGQALSMYLIGLLPMAFTLLLLNICYIYGYTFVPMIISLSTLAGDYYLNEFFKQYYGIAGIALATSIMNFVRLILYLILIEYKIKLHMNYAQLFSFLIRYSIQVIALGAVFFGCYKAIFQAWQAAAFDASLGFVHLTPSFFLDGLGLWIWVGPLVALYLGSLYFTRTWFKIEVMYL
jgi:peptidoglycan biosynthesis protein MviN/MurJ (putative lipid II flippase)